MLPPHDGLNIRIQAVIGGCDSSWSAGLLTVVDAGCVNDAGEGDEGGEADEGGERLLLAVCFGLDIRLD